VTLAFVHLHERKIAYRDLKPENVLITKRGYGKVTDMGLATLVLGRTFTLCGTPEYFSPEIITAAGHNWNVDWWTLGIFIYELMAGKTPFHTPSQTEMYKKIVAGVDSKDFVWAGIIQKNADLKDIIQQLLRKDPRHRLPFAKDIGEFKNHPWWHKVGKGENAKYQQFQWDDLQRGAQAEVNNLNLSDLPKAGESNCVPQWLPPPQNWKSKKPPQDKHMEPFSPERHGDDEWATYFDQAPVGKSAKNKGAGFNPINK